MEKEHKLSDRFRAVRSLLGLTQQQLAERLFLSRNYIAKIESDAKEPSARVVRDLESLRVEFENKEGTESTYRQPKPSDHIVEDSASYVPARGAPTRKQVEEYLQTYLDLAERVPGAVEHAYFEITEALPLQTIRRRLEKPRHTSSSASAAADRKIAELRSQVVEEMASARKGRDRSA